MESTEAHLDQLGATAEDSYSSLFDADAVNPIIDAFSGLIELVDNFVEGIGGGANALLMFGSIAAKKFSKEIGGAVGGAITNKVTARQDKKNLQKAEAKFNATATVDYASAEELLNAEEAAATI
jgi:hypothetical protein